MSIIKNDFEKQNITKIKDSKNKKKLTMITAYDALFAKLFEEIADMILVGDSLNMSFAGKPDTLSATLDQMIYHTNAVCAGAPKAFVILDMPFGTYNNKDQALTNAVRVYQETNAAAIKIEGGEDRAHIISHLTSNSVAVMGHIGLMPQHIKKYGGYKYQGINKDSMQEIINNAKSLEKSGAFSFVIEAVPAKLSDQISKNSNLITIGIGASRSCDGQILVIDDLLGLNSEFSPRFLKKYHNLEQEIINSVQEFCNEVKARKFPFDNNYF